MQTAGQRLVNDERGFDHVGIMVMVMVVFAVVGIYTLVHSSAMTCQGGVVGSADCPSTTGQKIYADGYAERGKPYCWDGGTIYGPSLDYPHPSSHSDAACRSGKIGFDCSGLVLYAVYRATSGGIKLTTSGIGSNGIQNHNTDQQVSMLNALARASSPRVKKVAVGSTYVTGDIIYYLTPGSTTSYHHVVIKAPTSGYGLDAHGDTTTPGNSQVGLYPLSSHTGKIGAVFRILR